MERTIIGTGVISFLSFQCKTAFNINTCHVISTCRSCFPLFDTDDLEIANCSIKALCFTFWAILGKHCLIKSCHEYVILTRKSQNCAGTAFVQGDSAGGSKLIEQTLPKYHLYFKLSSLGKIFFNR